MGCNEVTILQPQKPAVNFEYNFKEKILIPKSINNKLAKIALTHVLWWSLAYENEWYSSDH